MRYVLLPVPLTVQNRHFPTSLVLNYSPVKIGVIHGHQIIPANDPLSLLFCAQSMDVDILLSGNTNKFEAYKLGERFFLNPGSATGSWSMDTSFETTKEYEEENRCSNVEASQENDQKSGNCATEATFTSNNPKHQNNPSFTCTYYFILTESVGHSRTSCCNIHISAYRRRSKGRENGVQKDCFIGITIFWRHE